MIATSAAAAPAVFFNGDTAAGIQTFINTVAAADAAYNTANPGAAQQSTVFALDLTNSTGSDFAVTANGQTVYVKTTRAGSPAANNMSGDEASGGFTNWGVNYTSGDFNSAIAAGYTVSFFSDSGYSNPYAVNAAGLFVSDWGTCCASGTTPSGATTAASQIYMLFNGSTPLLVGGISTPITGEEHFVAAIDDRNGFNSVTLVPNGIGENFGAGGYLVFSTVQQNSVPAGSSVVTVGGGSTPDIDDDYTVADLLASGVNPVFDGGALAVTANASVSNDISIKSTGGTIDTQGHDAAFSGVLSDATGATGGLTKAGDGVLTFSGHNSYTGVTTIADGVLALSGAGTIASSAGVVADGVFDISATTSGATIKTLSGTGEVALGGKTLTIAAASGAFGGDIGGSGGVSVTGGALTLTGQNGFTGGLSLDGAQVFASAAANLGAGPVTIGDGTLHATGDFTAANPFVLTNADSTIDTGSHRLSLSGDISGGGALTKTGTGVLVLSGANSQQVTEVAGGSLLATSSAALGAAGGDLRIGADSTFVAGADMTVSQRLHIDGANAAVDTGANNVVLTGSVDGNQCLIKEGSGRLTLAAAASNTIGACVQQGTLSFNSVFDGKVWVDPSGVASGVGRINGDVEVRGRLAPGNSPGRLVVAGSVTQMAGSTLSLDIDGKTAGDGAGHFDTLVLTGAQSVYTAAGSISPVLRGITGAATNSFTPAIGDRFQVVTAEGGVVGVFDRIVQPTAGLPANSRFDVFYGPTAITLFLTPNDFRWAFGQGRMLNAASAGGAVDGFRTASGTVNTGASGALLDGLYPLDQAGLGRALEQASGGIYANAMDSAIQTTRLANAAASDRLNGAADSETPPASRLWGVASHDVAHVGADAYGQGYRAKTYTVVMGADRALGSKAVVGAAFAYGRSETSTPYAGAATADSYHGLVYGRVDAGPWYANGLASVGRDNFRVERRVDLATGSAAARGKTDGLTVAAEVEAGYRLHLGKTTLTPSVGAAYDRLRRDGLTETGAASVRLTLGDDIRRSLVARAGARIGTVLALKRATLVPYASVFVDRETADQSSAVAATLHGQRFAANAAEMGRTTGRLNLGVAAALSSTVSLQASYRYSGADNYRTNAVFGGVSIRW